MPTLHVAHSPALSKRANGLGAERDSILASAPDHLFALLLNAELARLASDTAGFRQAHSRFLETVDRELQSAKPEYTDHQSALDQFRQAAAGELN